MDEYSEEGDYLLIVGPVRVTVAQMVGFGALLALARVIWLLA